MLQPIYQKNIKDLALEIIKARKDHNFDLMQKLLQKVQSLLTPTQQVEIDIKDSNSKLHQILSALGQFLVEFQLVITRQLTASSPTVNEDSRPVIRDAFIAGAIDAGLDVFEEVVNFVATPTPELVQINAYEVKAPVLEQKMSIFAYTAQLQHLIQMIINGISQQQAAAMQAIAQNAPIAPAAAAAIAVLPTPAALVPRIAPIPKFVGAPILRPETVARTDALEAANLSRSYAHMIHLSSLPKEDTYKLKPSFIDSKYYDVMEHGVLVCRSSSLSTAERMDLVTRLWESAEIIIALRNAGASDNELTAAVKMLNSNLLRLMQDQDPQLASRVTPLSMTLTIRA